MATPVFSDRDGPRRARPVTTRAGGLDALVRTVTLKVDTDVSVESCTTLFAVVLGVFGRRPGMRRGASSAASMRAVLAPFSSRRPFPIPKSHTDPCSRPGRNQNRSLTAVWFAWPRRTSSRSGSRRRRYDRSRAADTANTATMHAEQSCFGIDAFRAVGEKTLNLKFSRGLIFGRHANVSP